MKAPCTSLPAQTYGEWLEQLSWEASLQSGARKGTQESGRPFLYQTYQSMKKEKAADHLHPLGWIAPTLLGWIAPVIIILKWKVLIVVWAG